MYLILLTFLLNSLFANCARPNSYYRSGGVVYPDDRREVFPSNVRNNGHYGHQTGQITNRIQSNAEKFEGILIKASNVRNAQDFLKMIGIEDDEGPITSRARTDKYAEQAACEPEFRTVELGQGDEGVSIIFPKCVRVKRCGGCCTSDRLQCVPTKISKVKVRRASVRFRRSIPSKETEIVHVDIHEACKCACKVKETECDPNIHFYENCNCNCKNTEEAKSCAKDHSKYWDSKDCSCKCRNLVHCSSGLSFSHSTCRCQAK